MNPWKEPILSQFTDPATRAEAEAAITENDTRIEHESDAISESVRAEYERAWATYEAARSRLMNSLLFEFGSIASLHGVAHAELTDDERAVIVTRRKHAAQAAWIDFVHAESEYLDADIGSVQVQSREP